MFRFRSFFSIALGVALFAANASAEESGFNNLLQGIIGNNGPDATADHAAAPADQKTGDDAKEMPSGLPTFEPMPFAVLRTLDKITARAKTIQVKTDEPFKLGNLLVVVKACRQRPPEEPPESAAFLQVAEEKNNSRQVKNVFSGWMFASSPGLSAVEHPIYDIWLVKCAAAVPAAAAAKSVEEKPATAPAKLAKTVDGKASKTMPLKTAPKTTTKPQ